MKLLNYFFTKAIGRTVAILIAIALLTLGFPTNVGGNWHLENIWQGEWWGQLLSLIIIGGACAGLIVHVVQEFNRVQKAALTNNTKK